MDPFGDIADIGDEDELDGRVFEGLTITELESRSFFGCTFRDVSMVEAVLERCVFDECSFEGCDLTMVGLGESSFRSARFTGCKLMGVDWSRAHQLSFAIEVERSVLTYASFVGMKLRKLRLIECKANEANFSEADLTDADFSGSDLTGAVFWQTILEGANLATATGYLVDPNVNRLGGTSFSIEAALAAARLLGIEVPDLEGAG